MRGIQLTEFPVASVAAAAPFDFRPFRAQTPLSRSLRPASIEDQSEERTPAPIRPLVLLRTRDTNPVVVDGYRRLREARAAGESNMPALLLPSNTPRQTVLYHALFGRSGGFSGMERVYAVYKSAVYARDGLTPGAGGAPAVGDDLLPVYSRFFSREVSRTFLLLLMETLKFPRDEQALLHALGTPADQLVALLELDAGERRGLLLLRSRIPFTASGTRKLIRAFILLRGIRSLRRFDLERWVFEKASSYNSRLRDKDLLEELRTISHPALARREKSITDAIRSLRLPPALTLRPPENLEGDAFSCYFSFSSVDEIEDVLGKLGSGIKDGSIKKLLEELNGD